MRIQTHDNIYIQVNKRKAIRHQAFRRLYPYNIVCKKQKGKRRARINQKNQMKNHDTFVLFPFSTMIIKTKKIMEIMSYSNANQSKSFFFCFFFPWSNRLQFLLLFSLVKMKDPFFLLIYFFSSTKKLTRIREG